MSRKIKKEELVKAVEEMVIQASWELEPETERLLKQAEKKESSPSAKTALQIILENIQLARKKKKPLCQDTGLSIFFAKIGRELELDFNLEQAINQGLEKASKIGYLRPSVADPLSRKNTGTNTPAIIHYQLTEGDQLEIELLLKGAGSENKSLSRVLSPAQGTEGIKSLVLETIKEAGAQSCPPLIVGLGIGGSLEMSALLAKKALLRPAGKKNPDPQLAQLEKELEEEINRLGIGASGLGGEVTCLSVQAEKFFGHIASLAITINLQCWAHRYARRVL